MSTETHSGMRTLDVDTCVRLLADNRFGRVAFDDGDGPVILPVNYVFHKGSVVFRSDLGSKVSAAEDVTPAAFEIDHVDEDRRVGWSVVVRGRIIEVRDQADLEDVLQAGIQPFVAGEGKPYVVRLEQRSITGRVTPLPEDLPEGWYRAAVLGTFDIELDD